MSTLITDHPGKTAIQLCGRYANLQASVTEKREAAAQLRRNAKACTLKSDAFALCKQAKAISAEAASARSDAGTTLLDMLHKAQEANSLLTQRMPPEWQSWGVTKTRAYKNLLAVLAVQLAKERPKPPWSPLLYSTCSATAIGKRKRCNCLGPLNLQQRNCRRLKQHV